MNVLFQNVTGGQKELFNLSTRIAIEMNKEIMPADSLASVIIQTGSFS